MSKKNVIWLNSTSFISILRETVKQMPNETGGILMGYRNSENDWVITKIIGPGSNAVHKRYSFIPDYVYHENEVARIYAESNCLETYLGDWHTHPEAASYLSNIDKKTLGTIAVSKEAKNKEPIMIILGTNPLEIKAWSYKLKGLFNDNFLSRRINFI